jgi:hypothetical protein
MIAAGTSRRISSPSTTGRLTPKRPVDADPLFQSEEIRKPGIQEEEVSLHSWLPHLLI